MSHLVSRLAAVCREHLLTEKILVVPSLAIGHQIADAVAQSGTPQALALIERACDQVLDSSSYFAALADRPGLHRAIQTSIDDLRHAGIDPSKIASAAPTTR